MPRGGYRLGAGRPKGAKDKVQPCDHAAEIARYQDQHARLLAEIDWALNASNRGANALTASMSRILDIVTQV